MPALLGRVMPMRAPGTSPCPWEEEHGGILWEGDTILAVGSADGIRAAARERGIEAEDLGSAVVVPGFVDAHTHFLHIGVKRHRPDLSGCHSKQQALARLGAWLADHPGGEPVIGERWDESDWTPHARPSRRDIDEVVEAAARAGHGPADRAVVLRRICGHVAVAGSAALGLVRRRWDRDELVDLESGTLLEEASLYLNEVLPATDEMLATAVAEATRECHALGITAVGDYSQAPYRQALLGAARAGRLRMRVASSIYVQQLDQESRLGFRTARCPTASGLLRDGGLKVFLDGSLGAHTAALREPYHDPPAGLPRGRLNWPDAEVARLFAQAHAAGIQVHAHAIGDAAIDQALDAFATLAAREGMEGSGWLDDPGVAWAPDGPEGLEPGKGGGKAGIGVGAGAADATDAAYASSVHGEPLDGPVAGGAPPPPGGRTQAPGRAESHRPTEAGATPLTSHLQRAPRASTPGAPPASPGGAPRASRLRHRIEHFEIVHEAQMGRAAELGVVASCQPNFVGTWSAKGGMYEERLGGRLGLNNRFRALLDSSVPLAFGSDGMPPGPLLGIAAAAQHPVPRERLGAAEALWHYTWWSAWSLYWEHEIGSLEAGKKADLVILEGNLAEPAGLRVKHTVFAGQTVHP